MFKKCNSGCKWLKTSKTCGPLQCLRPIGTGPVQAAFTGPLPALQSIDDYTVKWNLFALRLFGLIFKQLSWS